MTSENIHLEFTELNCDADHVANELNFLSDFYADYYESDNDDEGEKDEEEEEEEEEEVSYSTQTVKHLLRIREYYNIPKLKKSMKKNDIIDDILDFEMNLTNITIVQRRKKMWMYLTKLRTDKYLKQFIFWS